MKKITTKHLFTTIVVSNKTKKRQLKMKMKIVENEILKTTKNPSCKYKL